MKKIFSFCAFSLFIGIASFAQQNQQQQPKTPEERAERESQRLTKELTLTADQTSKVKSVLLKKEQDAQTIRTKYKDATDKTGERGEMKTLNDTKDAELKQIFTADQNTKYETVKQGGNRQGGGDEHHRGDGQQQGKHHH